MGSNAPQPRQMSLSSLCKSKASDASRIKSDIKVCSQLREGHQNQPIPSPGIFACPAMPSWANLTEYICRTHRAGRRTSPLPFPSCPQLFEHPHPQKFFKRMRARPPEGHKLPTRRPPSRLPRVHPPAILHPATAQLLLFQHGRGETTGPSSGARNSDI